MQKNFTLAKEWLLKKNSGIPLPMEARKEDFLEPCLQELPPVSDPQVAPRGIRVVPDTDENLISVFTCKGLT